MLGCWVYLSDAWRLHSVIVWTLSSMAPMYDDDEDQHPSGSNGGRHGNGGSSGEHSDGGNDGGNDDDDPKFGVIIRSSLVYKAPWELCKLIHPIHCLASLPLSAFADHMLVEAAVGSVLRCHCCDEERHLMAARISIIITHQVK